MEASPQAVQPPRKKLKATNSSIITGGAAGSSSQVNKALPLSLAGMNLDLLLYLCQWLDIVDLLRLSWTSTAFHDFLVNPKSAAFYLWKKYRLAVKLPDGPAGLSESQYINLAFGPQCHLCQEPGNDLYVVWSARIRVCSTCLANRTYFAPSVDQEAVTKLKNDFPEDLFSFLPSITVQNDPPHTYYHILTHMRWKREYQTASVKADWLAEKTKEQQIIKNHAIEAELWSKRTLLERRNMLYARISVLKKVLESHLRSLPPNALFPTMGDIISLPFVRDIIEDTSLPVAMFTETNLDPLREKFPDIALKWQNDIKAKLVDMVRSMRASFNIGRLGTEDPDSILELAITVFNCKCCHSDSRRSTLRYPEILTHFHATDDGNGNEWTYMIDLSREEDPETNRDIDEFVARLIIHTPWNAEKNIQIQIGDTIFLQNALAKAGFDPDVTTAAQMDAADPIFECIDCCDPQEGRCTMRWRMIAGHFGVPSHYPHNHPTNQPYPGPKLLDGKEAQVVRDRIAETNARLYTNPSSGERRDHVKPMICVHCRVEGGGYELTRHVKRRHDVNNPTELDIVKNRHFLPVDYHYLWPPREGTYTWEEKCRLKHNSKR